MESCVDVVRIHHAWQKGPGDMQDELEFWKEGLNLTAEHINQQGGLRMGRGKVGYVQMVEHEWHENRTADHHASAKIGSYYKGLCGRGDVDVLVLPLPLASALEVIHALKKSGCAKPVLTATDVDDIFEAGYSSLWSPLKKSTVWTVEMSDFLHDVGARKFVLVGDKQSSSARAVKSVENQLELHVDTKVLHSCFEDPRDGWEHCFDEVLSVGGAEPAELTFIGIGEGQESFEALVKFFQSNKYAPQAAMYMDLTAGSQAYDDSNQKGLSWLYDMWLMPMLWNSTMSHAGSHAMRDPYAANRSQVVNDGTDFARYLGTPADFAAYTSRRLTQRQSTRSLDVTHAKAAATLMMLQIAVEHAPGTDDYGLEFDKERGWDASQTCKWEKHSVLANKCVLKPGASSAYKSACESADDEAACDAQRGDDQFKEAMLHLDAHTFWGPVKMDPTGWNTGFTMGVAQFQNGGKDEMVGPQSLLPAGETVLSGVFFPADWDCKLTDTCWYWWQTLLIVATGLACLSVAVVLWVKRKRRRAQKHQVVRESLVGGASFMPDAQLATQDVNSRWHQAAQLQADSSSLHSTDSSPSLATTRLLRAASGSVKGGRQVMFQDAHLVELQPVDWNTEEHVLGKGSYGMVYKATWRGQSVAVKQVMLPAEPENSSTEARSELERRVKEISKDFVTEVEVCCDLAHPNLVRLMGYATKESLLMVQELMLGQAMDKQLYVERWRPSEQQIQRVAQDVAQGMKYLHTAFKDADGYPKPIMHRDLKSPNLLLARPPGQGPAGEVTVKISDFGLSREKERTQEVGTVMMTGCGSVLWMAPEILLAKKYNEKVDVFSYAMCLLELVDCNLPWAGVATSMEVPNRVTTKHRPDKQLRKANPQIRDLVKRCWQEDWNARPSFEQIVDELTGERAEPTVRREMRVGLLSLPEAEDDVHEQLAESQREIEQLRRQLADARASAALNPASGSYSGPFTGVSRPASPGLHASLIAGAE